MSEIISVSFIFLCRQYFLDSKINLDNFLLIDFDFPNAWFVSTSVSLCLGGRLREKHSRRPPGEKSPTRREEQRTVFRFALGMIDTTYDSHRHTRLADVERAHRRFLTVGFIARRNVGALSNIPRREIYGR